MSTIYEARAQGREAYHRQKPIWCNPHVGVEADAWRAGYLAERAAAGGVVFDRMPPRAKRGPNRIIRRRRRPSPRPGRAA